MRLRLIFLLLLLLLPETLEDSESSFVVDQFKAPNAITPEELVDTWRKHDENLWAYVESHVPAVLEHTGAAAFDDHLKGVQAVLRYWSAPEYLASAGLFHSIYGSEGFQGFSLPLSKRVEIQKMIGEAAEKLCFVFCMVDRSSLDETLWNWEPGQIQVRTLRARPELGRFSLELTHEEWLDFVELSIADYLEQIEGAATKENKLFWWKKGEAYSYRRTAYFQMRRVLETEKKDRLGSVVPATQDAIMATEPEETRKLVQLLNPPLSKAAEAAFAALRAAGEDIPIDFSPREIDDYPACNAMNA